MLCSFIRLVRTVEHRVGRAIRSAADWIGRRLRTLWSEHLDRVTHNAAYAAATAAVLSGVLGLIPLRDVLGTVLAAALGVWLKGGRHFGTSGDSMTRWDEPWDIA